MADDGISACMRRSFCQTELRTLSRALEDKDLVLTGGAKQPLSPTSSDPERDTVQAQMQKLPTWNEQITIRGIVLGAILGTLFSLIISRLNLGFGIQASTAMPARLSLCGNWELSGPVGQP